MLLIGGFGAHETHFCMENEIISIFSLKVKIYNLVALLRSVFSLPLSIYIGGRHVSWHLEESMVVVLNVDGNNFGNPRIYGFGGVLCRNDGSWLYGFAGNVCISTIIHVELLILYHGLEAFWERGYRDVICYSDSTLAV
jgi:ribonuclease HI